VSDVFTAALVGGLIGTFFGGFSKFLWELWLPGWLTWRRTQRTERERQLATIRGPAYLALADLQGRIRAIAHTQSANYHYSQAVGEANYYLHSTAYLVARAFAAQEALRQRMASYDYAELYSSLESVTRAFSAGHPGFQFFRLEQREIGERLLASNDSDVAAFLSLSQFLDAIEQEDRPRWMDTLCKRTEAGLDEPFEELDRMQAIDHALSGAMNVIDPKSRWIRQGDRQLPVDAAAIRSQLGADSPSSPDRGFASDSEP
jgi:hypothetical protein